VFKDAADVLTAWLVEVSYEPCEPTMCTVFDILGPATLPTEDEAGDGSVVPRRLRSGMTKRMLKQAPRFMKEEYRAGRVAPRKQDSHQ
jgi:hypothetical protein